MRKLFDKLKLKIDNIKDNREIDNRERKRLKQVRLEEQFKKERTELERRVEIEGLRAKVRKTQRIANDPKTRQKSGFEKFQDFATIFSQNQRSMVGDIGLNIGGQNGNKIKKSSKGNR